MHRSSLIPLLVATGILWAATSGQAQVFRSVGADGNVTFTDQPSSPGAAPIAQRPPAQASASGGALPYALAQVTARYPVTLYTSKDCSPCSSARAFLTQRGVPFTEKTVSTNADLAALKQLADTTSIPVLAVGKQWLTGFSSVTWSQYLDAAGYPKTSQLPSTWQAPAASPLVAVESAKTEVDKRTPAAQTGEAPGDQSEPAPAPSASNPAGIRF